MKNTLLLGMGLLIAASTGQIAKAQDYDGAEGEISLGRRPVQIGSGIDSDYRLRAMGGLNIAIEDEANTIGAFKFGESPAGLPLDYEEGKVEFDLFSEGGELEDESMLANTFEGTISDTKQGMFHLMSAIPFYFDDTNRGALAISVESLSENIETTSEYNTANGLTKSENEPDLSDFFIGYGHQLNHFLFGISIQDTDSDLVNRDSTTSSSTSEAVQSIKVQEIYPSIGFTNNNEESHNFTGTLGPVITSIEQEVLVRTVGTGALFGAIDSDVDGTGFKGAINYNYGPTVKAGLSVSSIEMDGDQVIRNATTSDNGKAELNINTLNARVLVTPESIPYSFGVGLASVKTESDEKTQNGSRIEDSETKSSVFFIGVTRHFGKRGLVGVELRTVSGETTDDAAPTDPDENEENDGTKFIVGGEFAFVPNFIGRLGFSYATTGEDPKGVAPEIDTKTATFDLGLEYILKNRPLSFALNLRSTGIANDGVQSNVTSFQFDKARFGAGSVHFVTKWKFEPIGI